MKFGIIYTVDMPGVDHIHSFYRPEGEEWFQTEGNEEYDYDYLGGYWETGAHEKWAALLDREAFDEFVDRIGLYYECDTMGALGMPGGSAYGLSPAFSMDGSDCDARVNAYVTPWPEVEPKREVTEERANRVWKRVGRAFKKVYR